VYKSEKVITYSRQMQQKPSSAFHQCDIFKLQLLKKKSL